MREIKFRVWHKDSEKMVKNISILGDEDYIYMQFTGLKDKNGKEIYEGDIVKGHREFIGEIIYDINNARFRFKKVDEDNHIEMFLWFIEWKSIEVIGNIYENPQLLNLQR